MTRKRRPRWPDYPPDYWETYRRKWLWEPGDITIVARPGEPAPAAGDVFEIDGRQVRFETIRPGVLVARAATELDERARSSQRQHPLLDKP